MEISGVVEELTEDGVYVRAIFDRHDEEQWYMTREKARELGFEDRDFQDRGILKIAICNGEISFRGVHEVWTQEEIDQIEQQADESHRLINWR